MNPLDTLKTKLINFLDKSDQDSDFNEALRDAINACNLNSVVALEQWLYRWVNWKEKDEVNRNDDHDYLEGVKFVEEKWTKITEILIRRKYYE